MGGVFIHSGAIFPLLRKKINEANAEILDSWKLDDKKNKLPILHYHGSSDPLFKPDPLMKMIDGFWKQLLEYKNFRIEFEENLKH